MAWSRPLEDPVTLSDGRTLITLRDAGSYIAGPPKAKHDTPEWLAAAESVLMAARKVAGRYCMRGSGYCGRWYWPVSTLSGLI